MNLELTPELMVLHEKMRESTAKAWGKPGWAYRDLPNMLPEFWFQLLDWIGVDEYKLITQAERTWPDGVETIRGQILISPIGLKNLERNSEDYRSDEVD